jgi:uncharacterized protein YndB with AHSA1/START domain
VAAFTAEVHIDAPVESVWDVLADIGAIHTWNPGVVESHVTSETSDGVGASRRCNLAGNTYFDEDVVEWSPNEAITFRIVGTNMPFARADIAFRLQPEGGGTLVTVSPDYAMKFGPLGWLMDALMVRRNYRKGVAQLLDGLRAQVESSV